MFPPLDNVDCQSVHRKPDKNIFFNNSFTCIQGFSFFVQTHLLVLKVKRPFPDTIETPPFCTLLINKDLEDSVF